MFGLSKNNFIVVLTNVLFFMIVQTLFFIFIASKQVDNVIKDKVGILQTYAKYDAETNQKIQDFLNSPERKKIEEEAKKQEEARSKINLDLIKKKVGIPVAIAGVLLIILIILVVIEYRKNPDIWSNTDTLALALVVFAYITELYVYFAIISKYSFVGDHELYHSLFDGTFTKIKEKSLKK